MCYCSEGEDGVVSIGQGVEIETLQLLITRVFDQNAYGLFSPTINEKLTMTPSVVGNSIASSSIPKLCMKAGVLLAMACITLRQLPTGFNPLQLLWLLHQGDDRCWTRAVLLKFAPDMVSFIDRWREAGTTGDLGWGIAQLYAYLNMNVSALPLFVSPKS